MQIRKLLKPSEVSDISLDSLFGWPELEDAAQAIIAYCKENGDTFDQAFTYLDIELMFPPVSTRYGFLGLVSRSLLASCTEDLFDDVSADEYPWHFYTSARMLRALAERKEQEDAKS